MSIIKISCSLLIVILMINSSIWSAEIITAQVSALPATTAASDQVGDIDHQINKLHKKLVDTALPPEETLLQAEELSRQGFFHHKQQNFSQALPFFEKALQVNPDYHPARLMLADTLLSLDRATEAEPLLKQLQTAGFQPARVSYLLGLTAAQNRQYSQALDYFHQAEADPRVAQAARYQISLIQAEKGQLQEARRNLESSIALGPQTRLASVAQNYIQALDQSLKREIPSPVKIHLATGFDYDANVTLRPNDEQAAQLISRKGDLVYSHNVYVEVNPLVAQPVELLLQYTYFQNFHRRLSKYDMVSHIAGLTPIINYQQWRFYFPFNFQYNDLASDKYYTAFDLRPTCLYLLTPNIGLEGGLIFTRSYFWTPLELEADSRSGRHLGATIGGYYFFNNYQGFLQTKFTYGRDYTSGDNWDASAYRLLLAAQVPLLQRLKVNSYIMLSWTPYDNPWDNGTATAFPKRHDFNFQCRVDLTYVIYKGLEANVHYYYENNDSNINLYWYDKHLVGAVLAYKY